MSETTARTVTGQVVSSKAGKLKNKSKTENGKANTATQTQTKA